MDLFLVPYSRVSSYRSVMPAELMAEGYTFRNLLLWHLEWYWGLCHVCSGTAARPLSFAFTWHIRRSNNTRQVTKKKKYIGPLPHPLPSPWMGIGWWHWLQAITSKCSNCISYNFFIFCPICMKFSHKFLHTYCFILCIAIKERFENNLRKLGRWYGSWSP